MKYSIINAFIYLKEWIKWNLSNEKIIYNNWWPISESNQDLWFKNFLIDRKIPLQEKIIFTSVFGKRNKLLKHFNGKKVFFSGENLSPSGISTHGKKYFSDYRINEVDLALGYEYINHAKYLRFPLWLLYFTKPSDSLEDIQLKINTINNTSHRFNMNRKRNFVLIASHDIPGIRTKMSDLIQPFGDITYAGSFRKNTNELKEKYQDNKINYLKQFRFNICPENGSEKGYITEKIFEAIISGCIPIYWGGVKSEVEPEILNQDSFIHYVEGNEKEFLAQIENLISNEENYENFCKIQPFKDGAAEVIWKRLNELERRLRIL